jgi:crossover junction endodeoxyribonuclease RuvC
LKTERIIGIDPGLTATGVGIVTLDSRQQPTAVYAGTICPSRTHSTPQKLLTLRTSILELIERFEPTCLAVEETFYHKNVKSALALGQARGAALIAAAEAGIDVVELSPKTVKQAAVGTGGAAKTQVAAMVTALLRLDAPPDSPDACDALAVALAALNRRFLPAGVHK